MTNSVERESQRGPGPEAAPGLTLGEACGALGLSPATFRQIISEFEDLLDEGTDEEGDVALLGPAALGQLRVIVQWRNQGVPAEEIRKRLQEAGEESAAAAPQAGEHLLLNQLERLNRELQRSEERRVEDRDRMLTAMMRTQQEIQHLRYSLTIQSRRERKKKGLFSRLFG